MSKQEKKQTSCSNKKLVYVTVTKATIEERASIELMKDFWRRNPGLPEMAGWTILYNSKISKDDQREDISAEGTSEKIAMLESLIKADRLSMDQLDARLSGMKETWRRWGYNDHNVFDSFWLALCYYDEVNRNAINEAEIDSPDEQS